MNTQTVSQLTLFTEPDCSARSRNPPKSIATEIPPCGSYHHWVGEYDVERGRYYRYYWRIGESQHHIHIRGSGVGTVLGDYRARLVREAIEAGKSPADIRVMIARFPRSRRNCRYAVV
jgi:hypothetical protein